MIYQNLIFKFLFRHMNISKEEIEHLAKLARLELTLEEKKKYQEQLSLILGYFKKLEELDVSELQVNKTRKVRNILREDKVEECDKITQDKILKSAADVEDRQIKVKSILASK